VVGLFTCLECRELDKVIAHYRELRRRVTDRLTLQGIDLLNAEAGQKEGATSSAPGIPHNL
jgi:hypothetical protein